MKAWYLSTVDGDDGYFCVFADTRNQARAQADSNDMFYDSWLDIVAKRFKGMDDKEHLSKRELDFELWRNHGWNWLEYDAPDEAETTDAQFYEWYDSTFGADK
jgi:hypothetical protein